jgi:hypothetical protein
MWVPVLVQRELGRGVTAVSNQNIKDVAPDEEDKGTVHDIMQKWSAKKYNVISEEIR